jgi:ComF family protein
MGKAEAIRLAVTRQVAPAIADCADALLAATLAPRCAACAAILTAPLAGPVCPACWDAAFRSDGAYDGPLRQIIHAFKYEGRRSLAPPLAALLRHRGADLLAGADCVVPVPLFPWRRLQRGFNQAADLCRHMHLPVVHAIWRIRPTARQTGLSAAERRGNVRGAFRLSPLVGAAARARFIDGRIIVLVDDVMTTGATLHACACVLEGAGAREVRPLTVARAQLTTTSTPA